MKKIMILGGGNCQVNLIKAVKERGHQAIVVGYYQDSPGKKTADIPVHADIFSYEEVLYYAKKYAIDALVTSGTDQPVYTGALVAEELNLPQMIDVHTAFQVTNKKAMKNKFKAFSIKTLPFAFIKKDFSIEALKHLKAPIVMKPIDSQGQRGIFKLESLNEIENYIDETLSYSRCDEVLIESYYENKEVTVSGWVSDSQVNVLSISDRVTFNNEINIGICKSHEYPSIHLKDYQEEIIETTKKICEAFSIKEGPIYFQMLIGNEGLYVNEIACRLGGAYEDMTLPELTGIDVLDLLIKESLGEGYKKKIFKEYSYSPFKLMLSTQLFFCQSGHISSMTDRSEILKDPRVLGFDYNYAPGDFIPRRENASQRAGYLIIKEKDEKTIQKAILDVFKKIEVLDDFGNNLIIKGKRWYR